MTPGCLCPLQGQPSAYLLCPLKSELCLQFRQSKPAVSAVLGRPLGQVGLAHARGLGWGTLGEAGPWGWGPWRLGGLGSGGPGGLGALGVGALGGGGARPRTPAPPPGPSGCLNPAQSWGGKGISRERNPGLRQLGKPRMAAGWEGPARVGPGDGGEVTPLRAESILSSGPRAPEGSTCPAQAAA